MCGICIGVEGPIEEQVVGVASVVGDVERVRRVSRADRAPCVPSVFPRLLDLRGGVSCLYYTDPKLCSSDGYEP